MLIESDEYDYTPINLYLFYALFNLVLSIIEMIIHSTGSVTAVLNIFVFIILVIFFCLFLRRLCMMNHIKLAWFFAGLPFLFLFMKLLLFVLICISPPPP